MKINTSQIASKLIGIKKERQEIKQGAASLRDVKDGETIRRVVNGELVEYTRAGSRLFSKTLESDKGKNTRSRFDTGNSLMSRPNFDSGWFSITNASNYDIDHYLGTKFVFIQSFLKDSSDRMFWVSPQSWGVNSTSATNWESGLSFYMESDNRINMGTMQDMAWVHDNTSAGVDINQNKIGYGSIYGKARVFLWRFFPTDAINPQDEVRRGQS